MLAVVLAVVAGEYLVRALVRVASAAAARADCLGRADRGTFSHNVDLNPEIFLRAFPRGDALRDKAATLELGLGLVVFTKIGAG